MHVHSQRIEAYRLNHICIIAKIVMFRVKYTVSLNYFRWADGLWHFGREDKNQYERKRDALDMNRVEGDLDGKYKFSDKKPSFEAQDKVIEYFTPIAQEWASNNQSAMIEAEKKDLRERIHEINQEIDSLDTVRNEKINKKNALVEQLDILS